jgi:polyphosphate kinase 2 (PPK2 family)
MAASVDHGSDLLKLRERLAALQLPQIVHHRRAIILFEGLEGSGKKAALRELASAFDPCHYQVHRVMFDRRQSSQGHWLAPFWGQLPQSGQTVIFHRSWYRRVLDDRVLGRVDDKMAPRAFDEINEFEAQQRDHGTLILKLFFTISPEVQASRIAKRADCPWNRAMRKEEAVSAADPAYLKALADLKAHSDTRWSPWRMIDGDDEAGAAKAALTAIADAWTEAMPAEPPHLVEMPGRAA